LFCLQARIEQQTLAVPGTEHVEVDPNMRIEEAFAEKSALAAGRDADKEH
jgi:hypothetical protein